MVGAANTVTERPPGDGTINGNVKSCLFFCDVAADQAKNLKISLIESYGCQFAQD